VAQPHPHDESLNFLADAPDWVWAGLRRLRGLRHQLQGRWRQRSATRPGANIA
jgi:hypothetical protein